MTLIGKITIVNTLVNTLFIHKLSALPSPPDSFYKIYKDRILNFLWNGKSSKISYNKLVQNYDRLGLKLVDLKTKEIALKATWPIRWKDRDPKELKWVFHRLPILDKRLWECNINPRDVDVIATKIGHTVITDIWKSWAKCTYKPTLEAPDEMLDSLLWGNSLIRCGNAPIFEQKIVNSNIEKVIDIFDTDTKQFLSFNQITQNFGQVINYLTYCSLIAAIPRFWKVTIKNSVYNEPFDFETKLGHYGSMSSLSRIFYWEQIANDFYVTSAILKIWERDLNITLDERNWWALFPFFLQYVKPAKYRVFQYKILSKSIVTNVKRNKWDNKISSRCHFCKAEDETIIHLFCTCTHVRKMWVAFCRYFSHILQVDIQLCPEQIIFNHYKGPKKAILNILIVVMKHYIYVCKCCEKPLNFMEFMTKVSDYYYCDKYITENTGKHHYLEKKWKNIF